MRTFWGSPEWQHYFAASISAANRAFANRQVIVHQIREAFATVFGRSAEELGMDLVYAHKRRNHFAGNNSSRR